MVLSTGLIREQESAAHTAFAELFGEWEKTSFQYDGRLTGWDAAGDTGSRQFLSLEHRFTPRFRGVLKGLHARDPNAPEDDEQYLLPGGYWNLTSNLNFSLLPSSGTYEFIASRHLPELDTSLSYRLSEDVQSLDSEHHLSGTVDLGLGVGQRFDLDEEYLYAQLRYRPGQDPSQYIQTRVEHASGHTGYALTWEKQINRSTRLQLGYSYDYQDYHHNGLYDHDAALERSDRHIFFLTLSTTFSRIGDAWRASPAGVSTRRGAVVGSIRDQDGSPVSLDGLTFRLDRRTVPTTATDSGGYRLDQVPVGIHTLALNNDRLPMEYAGNEEKAYMVEVVPAGVTRMDIKLEKMFAVSGQVTENGSPSAGVRMRIRTADRVVADQVTDQFGYYQFTGIPNGSYELMANDTPAGKVTVQGDFLFGVDVELGRDSVPKNKGEQEG